MENGIIKPVIRVGNSAGVLLPKSWVNGKAKIELVTRPLNIKRDVLEILDSNLEQISGIYLTGSYARKEEDEESDIDILALTKNENKKIIKGKYNILLISIASLEKAIDGNALPLIPMLKEAKAIMNQGLLDKYKKSNLTKKNIRWYLETTTSAINLDENLMELSKEEDVISDNLAYSLVLRLRGLYIIDSLNKNQVPNKKGLIRIIEKVSGSKKIYEGYLRSKKGEANRKNAPKKEAEKLLRYIKKRIKEI